MSFISFLEENMLPCYWKSTFGIDCFGCGMQRSIIHLIKGEFTEAFYMYPAIYTLLIMFGYLGAHLKMNFKNGHKILLTLFVINAIIIVLNYSLNHLH